MPEVFHLRCQQPGMLCIVALAVEIGEFVGANQCASVLQVEGLGWSEIRVTCTDPDIAMAFKFRFSDRFYTPTPESDMVTVRVQKPRDQRHLNFDFKLDRGGCTLIPKDVIDEGDGRYLVAG